MNSRETLQSLVERFTLEMASFEDKGRNVAGRRARAVLQEISKFTKETRKDISAKMKKPD